MIEGDTVRCISTDAIGTVIRVIEGDRECSYGSGCCSTPAQLLVRFADGSEEWLFERDVEDVE